MKAQLIQANLNPFYFWAGGGDTRLDWFFKYVFFQTLASSRGSDGFHSYLLKATRQKDFTKVKLRNTGYTCFTELLHSTSLQKCYKVVYYLKHFGVIFTIS